jgi:hypothetical protein
MAKLASSVKVIVQGNNMDPASEVNEFDSLPTITTHPQSNLAYRY